MHKMTEFYQNKEINMLKLGCTQTNLANICLRKSTKNQFYPFVEAGKDLQDKIREVMTGVGSIGKIIEKKTFPLLTINFHLYILFI